MNPRLSAYLSSLLVDRRHHHRRQVVEFYKAKMRDAFQDHPVDAPSEALADILRHAAQHVPFYKASLSGVEITPTTARDVLKSLPVITRADLQRDGASFRANCALTAWKDATGGSTGTPLEFMVDRRTQQARESSLMWADSLAGWNYGERIAMLWGSDRDARGALSSLRLRLRWQVDNRRWFNAFDSSEDEMVRWHQELERFQPHLIVAYAGTLYLFARILLARRLRPTYPLRALVSSAEVLSAPMRQVVEEVFPTRVFDRYGNREFGALAAECHDHHGMHLNTGDSLIEIDSPDPTHIPGPILVTYFHNYAMPFLRYNTGDLGVWASSGPCPCGRWSPRLGAVLGRQSDTIRTAHGRLIHGEYFTHLLYGVEGVREFQFVQESLHDYKLLVVGNVAAIQAKIPAWQSRIAEEVGPGARVEVVRVDQIPVLPSGKRRFTLSKVGLERG